MIYRLKELKGDTIAVPQLVFSKLGIAEEYNVRVALYVLATGVTDPDKLCADLKLRSRISAESALAFWAGAGLLERYEENAAPGAEPSAPAPMRWAEIAAASRTDPMISSLIDCGQTSFARPLTHAEMEKLVNLYVQEGFAPETVMLCVAYVASRGKRTMAAVTHELKVWRAEGVETGEQADAHLKLLALRQSRAITSALASFLGPSGSTACNVSNTAWPVRASSRSCQNCPVPKRVSCFAAKLMMGSSSQPCSVSCCAAASAASSVQKLPHTANAMRPFFCVLMCVPPAPAKWSARCAPPLPRPCPAHRRRAG